MSELHMRSSFEYDEHVHTFMGENGDIYAQVVLSSLSDGRDNAVNGEASVKFLFGQEDSEPVLDYQRVNLTNKTSANGWIKIADALKGHSSHEWEILISRMVSSSMREWREAASEVEVLGEINPDDVQSPFLIEPFVSSVGLTHLYGPQGSGKSMLTMGLCICLTTGYPVFGAKPETTGNVLYADFEDSAMSHRPRLTGMLEGIEWEGDRYDIIHYKAAGKLTDHTSRIRRIARKHDVVAIVVDSLGRARGGDPSDGGATIQLMNALGSLPGPVIGVDHVTKAIKELIDEGRLSHPESVSAIGSQFSGASARLGWFIQRMTTSTPQEVKFNLTNNKYNIVAQQEPRSISMELEWNERHILTKVKFNVWDSLQFMEVQHQTVEAKRLIGKYMLEHGLNALTATQATTALDMPRTTINSAFKDPSWFLRLPKQGRSVPYQLTPYGTQSLRSDEDVTKET